MIPVETLPVEVVRAGRQFRLVAARAIEEGALLFDIEGESCHAPTQWSVQVGPREHITVPAAVDLESQLDHYPWRFMNHSCDPNARVDARQVFALRAIEPGEEITFDYNTTEWEMAVPFDCQCGSEHCAGRVSGRKDVRVRRSQGPKVQQKSESPA